MVRLLLQRLQSFLAELWGRASEGVWRCCFSQGLAPASPWRMSRELRASSRLQFCLLLLLPRSFRALEPWSPVLRALSAGFAFRPLSGWYLLQGPSLVLQRDLSVWLGPLPCVVLEGSTSGPALEFPTCLFFFFVAVTYGSSWAKG